MEMILGIAALLVALIIFYNHKDPLEEFIKKNKWDVISKEKGPFDLNLLSHLTPRINLGNVNISKTRCVYYTVTYYDKRKFIHETILCVRGKNVTVFTDKIIKRDLSGDSET